MHHPRHHGVELTANSPLLQPGLTCWRTARAGRFAPIVDAAAYFAHARNALLRARHSVLFISWEFDARIELDPDHPQPDWPNRLGRFLSALAERRPGLRIQVLQWNLGVLGTFVRGATPLYVLNWLTTKRVRFKLDSAHPPGASHHQKILVIDDALAFCGGIDMTDDRWDTQGHRDGDARRRRPSGRRYGPFHDATVAVDGPAAAALGDLARERWRRATGERLEPPPRATDTGADVWPEGLTPLLRDVEVGIARTEPAYDGRPAVREIEKLYLAAIAAARHTIYIEGQYFAARCIGETLAARLREPDGPEVVVVNSERARGWLEEKAMGVTRQRVVVHMRHADPHDRFRIYTPVTAAGTPIYVHAKVLVVDRRFLRIGSSNLNNRSMGLDTECDLAVEAAPGSSDREPVAPAVEAFRDALVAEHLGVDPDRVTAAVGRTGSLIKTIETLRCTTGRTLVPLELPIPPEAQPPGEGELLDPEQAEPVWKMMVHALEDRLSRRR